MALKLKEAGLERKPEFGDFYWREEDRAVIIYCGTCYGSSKVELEQDNIAWFPRLVQPMGDVLWLPRLDQLLREIERRDWYVSIDKFEWGYQAFLYEDRQGEPWLVWDNHKSTSSWEDAAAEALLWILEREDKGWCMV